MKNQTQALEYASVLQYCKAVRLPTVGANFVPLAEQAVKENHSHIRYLEAVNLLDVKHGVAFQIRDFTLDILAGLLVPLRACNGVSVDDEGAFLALPNVSI